MRNEFITKEGRANAGPALRGPLKLNEVTPEMNEAQKTALIFPGQGSQVVGMGKDLFNNFESAKAVFRQVDEVLKRPLSQIMFEGPSEELTKTENAQPALMAVSMAIINVLERDFGKNINDLCAVVAGHSLGEYSALCAAKAITLTQACELLETRGRSMSQCGEKNPGLMAAVLGSDLATIEKLITQTIGDTNEICQIANDNSSGQVVISGSKSAIERSVEIAKGLGIKRVILLPVSGAFHSKLMDSAAKIMEEKLLVTEIKTPLVPLISNVSASLVSDPSLIRTNLIAQITGQVRWRETMLALEEMKIENAIEVGSGRVLSGLASKTVPSIKTKSIADAKDIETFLT